MGIDDSASTARPISLRDRSEVTDHFIPVPLLDLRPLLERRRGGTAQDGEPSRLIELLLRQATQSRVDRLKFLFSRCQPADGLIRSDALDPTAIRDADRALLQELEATLSLANYRPLPREEIEAAFSSEAIFDVKVEVSLEEFDELLIYVRGRHRKSETIRRFLGMKRRKIHMTVFDRVFFLARRASPLDRARSASADQPPLVVKLFAGIPSADLEMLFPNSKVRMRPMDAAFIAVPAIAGLFGVGAKVLSSALALYAVLLYSLGWSEQPPPDGLGAAWAAVGAGFFALLAFCIGRYNSYKNKHLRFASTLTKTLYFRTLDSEAGAFLRVLEEATEEEIKEAVLAYEFLRDAPCDETTLDERIEAWFREELSVEMDFEVDDALGKLDRLGIASLRDGIWHALPAAEAREALLARWQSVAIA